MIEATSEFKKLKVDLIRYKSERWTNLLKQFTVLGVPIIAFIDFSGREVEIARVVEYLKPDSFLKKVNEVEN